MLGGDIMKHLLALFFIFTLLGCETPPQEAMKGEKISGQMSAYTKMCERDPESPLCTADEIGVTNATDLNQRLCQICAQDDSYSFCKHNKHCADYTYKPQIKPEPQQGESMQGEKVRLRAQAYRELCNREPDSVLCDQGEK